MVCWSQGGVSVTEEPELSNEWQGEKIRGYREENVVLREKREAGSRGGGEIRCGDGSGKGR